jgi:predicted ABC-type ATPase
MSAGPWLWLIAGPNGAGKSTYIDELFEQKIEVIRPDNIATALSPKAPERAAFRAGREAISRMSALIRARRAFAAETTLSGKLQLRLVQRAKREGWRVGLAYIGLASSDLAIERVRQRKLAGGHDVPARDVRRRYRRSLRNLEAVFGIVDEAIVLDNSSAPPGMKRVLAASRGKVQYRARKLPAWLPRRLRERAARAGRGTRKS